MKVLLINPPRFHKIMDNTPLVISEIKGFLPPLGLLYVAAYLQKHASHEIVVLDAQVEELDEEGLLRRMRKFRPDVVGITAMTMTLIDVLETIKLVRQANPSVRVVLGGPHVHLFPEETIRLQGVDFLVLGEGEETFKDLLDSINDLNSLEKIKGLVFRKDDKVVNTGVRSPIKDLDALPFPARDLVPYKKYSSILAKQGLVTSIFTSRGCPFKCTFCDRPNLGKTFRARSARNVVEEMEECLRMGIHEFLVYDDTFTVDKQRVIDICDEIIQRKMEVSFDIRARVDTVNEEMIVKLKHAGCCGIHYGIEAGTEKILKILNKGISIEDSETAFSITRKHGIATLAYFMIGNPTETREDIECTMAVMRRLNPDFVHLTVLTPFPGTQIYQRGLESGVLDRDSWREFAEDPNADFIPPHWGENFTREELAGLAAQCYKRFYLRPSYIFHRFWRIGSWDEFKKHVAGFFHMLKLRRAY